MYKDYTNIRQEDGLWVATVYEYEGDRAYGHPINVYTEEVSEPAPDLPEIKSFDTGHVHMQFDFSSQEYKDFCSDPRISEFLNNQTVKVSYQGLQARKQLVAVLEAEGVITSVTAGLIQALFDTWLTEVANPTP